MDAGHIPVLLHECIDNLNIRPDGIYVDGTLGMGGHSEQIAGRLTTGTLIGIDRDETNELVDNVCAFVRPGEVLLAWTDDPADPQYACSQACLRYLEGETDAQGRRIRVHKMPIPRVPVLVTQEDLEGYTFEDGEDVREADERLAASYVNYYCANGAIVLPAFGGENAASDAQAAAILAGLFPERRIISVYAREILTGGGNIHCITQQIPEGAKL